MFPKWTTFGVFFDVPGADGGAGGTGGGDVDLGTVIEGAIADQGEVKPDPNADPNEEAEIGKLAEEWAKANPNARGHIKIDRHQAVLTRNRNQHAKALEEWAAKEKAWQEAETKYKQEMEGLSWAKDPEILQALQFLAMANDKPESFVEELLKDERFAKMLQLKEAQEERQIPNDRPRPNQRTPEGLEYYDDDGLDALLQWHQGRSTKDLEAKLTKQFEEKYGGVAKAFEATTLWNKSLADAKVKLDSMRKDWPEFAKYENDIKALMNQQGNEHMPVDEAYRQVVVSKLLEREKVNRDTLRKELIEEMKGKKAAADGVEKNTGIERVAGRDEDRDIADVIRESIRGVNG